MPLTIPSSLTATLQSFIGLNSCYKIIALFSQRYFLSLALFNLPLWKLEQWLRKKKDDDSQIQFSNKILNHAEDGNELILHKMP